VPQPGAYRVGLGRVFGPYEPGGTLWRWSRRVFCSAGGCGASHSTNSLSAAAFPAVDLSPRSRGAPHPPQQHRNSAGRHVLPRLSVLACQVAVTRTLAACCRTLPMSRRRSRSAPWAGSASFQDGSSLRRFASFICLTPGPSEWPGGFPSVGWGTRQAPWRRELPWGFSTLQPGVARPQMWQG
jgi:hypothetical protein